MWRALRHPNVLSLIGVMKSETQFAMISDWMANGNVTDFVKAHPDTNRLKLVGFSLKPLAGFTSIPLTVNNPSSWGVSQGG